MHDDSGAASGEVGRHVSSLQCVSQSCSARRASCRPPYLGLDVHAAVWAAHAGLARLRTVPSEALPERPSEALLETRALCTVFIVDCGAAVSRVVSSAARRLCASADAPQAEARTAAAAA